MKSHYPFPWTIIPDLVSAAIKKETRTFRFDSGKLITRISPPVVIIDAFNNPFEKPYLLTVNHYAHPGFSIMWAVIAISAYIPVDVHWIMTNAWVYPNPVQKMVLKPLSHIILSEIARIYKFSSMPPMPPSAADVTNRAVSIRKVFDFVRNTKLPVIGMAPEGRDMPYGVLGWPPPGTGRLILELSKRGLSIMPVGASEEENALHIRFGEPYELDILDGLSTTDLDRHISHTIMRQIANNIPFNLRGDFA
jgi:hypothetical protein